MTLVRTVFLFAILGVAPLLLPAPVQADFRPSVAVEAGDSGAALLVNGRLIARLRTESAGLLPAERAELAAERLRAAIERGLKPGAVGVKRIQGAAALTLGDASLLLATPEEAHANQARALVLARRWALRLRSALALPGLTLSRQEVVVPYQETRSVRIGGVATGDINLDITDERVASADIDLAQGAVTVRALTPGMTRAQLSREGAVVTLQIIVKKYAGQVGGAVTAEVTGRPASADLITAAVRDGYREAVALEPGAQARLLGSLPSTRPLEPGAATSFQLPVAITGNGYLPLRSTVTVQVRNRPIARRETGDLFYSNDPEQVRRFGVLFYGRLEDENPTRLLYHHQNRMARAFYLSIDLINTGSQPAQIQVIEGAAKPIVDTVLVGHRAGVRYLRHALLDIGIVVEVPPGTRRTILAQRVAPLRTASGIFGLRTVSGAPPTVQVFAGDRPIESALRPAGDRLPKLSDHVYPRPRKEIRARYRVGERWVFVSLGKRPIDGREAPRRLDGNYGVFYEIDLEIENPTAEENTVNLVLAAEAGAARGVFLVDGQLIEIPNVSPPAEFILGSLVVKPMTRGSVVIRTLPVGGSAYPVTLVVRPRRPGEPQHPLLTFRGGMARLMETQPNEEIPGN